MRQNTPVSILLPNRYKAKRSDPEFVKVPGVVVSDPSPSTYVNRNTGAIINSQTVEVISLRDTRASNPAGGRVWYQVSTEPVGLLLRRADPVTSLDVDAKGKPVTTAQLWGFVEASIIEFRTRQAAARRVAEARPVIQATPAAEA